MRLRAEPRSGGRPAPTRRPLMRGKHKLAQADATVVRIYADVQLV